MNDLPSIPVKILVVRNEISDKTGLESLSKHHNLELIFTDNGTEAEELLKTHPDTALVIMNSELKFGNGYDTAINIRKTDTRLPIILLVNYHNLNSFRLSALLGNIHMLQLPVNAREMESITTKLILEHSGNHADSKKQ
ncbi:MAG: hypothetical protein AB9842_09785 [Bacteroidales bacterium]